MREIRLLAIDLDGTLVDSAPDLSHCVDCALESVGLVPPGEELTRGWIGDGIETLLQRAFAHAGAAHDAPAFRAAYDAFSACYRDNLFVRSRLYPEVETTLADLDGRGIPLACITNKRFAFADALLVQAGIRDRFRVLLGGDSLAEKKPSSMQLLAAARDCNVAPAHAAMVGDSHHDYHAAADAGFAFIWACYGYCRQIPARRGVTYQTIAGFAELRAAIAAPRAGPVS
jgi:phosphoglycolate phosphatase